MKIKKIVSALLSSAVLISGQTSGILPTQKAQAAPFKSRVSVHDPSIFKDSDGTYYVFGSHIDAAKSTDLQSWNRFTNGYTAKNNTIFGDLSGNLAKSFAWAGEDLEDCEGGFAVWAPDVIYNPDYVNKDGSKGAYMMYFCTTSTYMRSVISYAVSQKAEGPYTFVDTLIYSGFTENDSFAVSNTKNVNRKYTSTNVDELIADGKVTWNNSWFNRSNFNNQLFPNAIDPNIYYDTDGNMYMCYGSWSGGIFTHRLDKATGRVIHPKSGTTSDGRMIDSYFGTKISGGYGKSGEAPYIKYNEDTGYYYLWVTYGGLFSEGGYNMRVFRSQNPDGPYTDPSGKSAVLPTNANLDTYGLKVMGNYKFSSLNTAYMACGHNSVFEDDDDKWYLISHARFDDGTEYHEVRVHSMYFNSEEWPVVAPYEYSGDVLSEGGYNESDIVGEYELVNHGLDTSATIHKGEKITLGADGKISGTATGTWSQAKDSAQASFVIGGQRYDGYFLAAQDETGKEKKVMSFTAVGSDNQTVWGVQTKQFTGTDRSALIDYTSSDSNLSYSPDLSVSAGNSRYIGETELLSGIPYFITNKNSGLLLEVEGGKTEAGTNIQQWEMNKGPHHEWRITDQGGGWCRISLMSDETMAVTVDGNDAQDGLNIALEKYTGADNQLFRFVKNGSSYGIVSKCSDGKAGLDVFEWSTENGGNINQWNYWGGDCQLWKLTPVYPAVTDGTYTIKNVNSGKWVSSENGNIIQKSSADAWKITPSGDGSFYFTDGSGNALTVEKGSPEDGTNISISPYNDDKSQKFNIICNKDGSYSILSAVTDGKSCLDVFEISTEDGANICQWNFWGGEGQKFILEPAAEISSEQPDVLYGDANCDGIITLSDAVLMMQVIGNPDKYGIGGTESTAVTPQGMLNGDCSDVGSGITNLDALAVQRYLLKLIEKLPE